MTTSTCNRREFLRTSALLGAGTALRAILPRGAAAAAASPVVARAAGAPAPELVRAAVARLGGMGAFVEPGARVVVKPNIGWDRTPEQAANTNPLVVREVVRLCLEAGAAEVRVFDRPCNDARRCYVNSGIAPALEELGDPRVQVSHIDRRRFRRLEIPGGTTLDTWSFYEDVLDADRVINVPVAKHHSASVLTLGMKNVMGVIGKNRATLHSRIHENLPDLNRVVRSDLTLMDATRILVANGPQGGSLDDVRQLDTVLAGADVVAVDSVTTTLFDLQPADVGYLRLAAEQGLGVADLAQIEVADG